MKIITIRRLRWSGPYGDTHHGRQWLLFNRIPIWRTRRRVDLPIL